MIEAPTACRSAGVSALTVALVPTGMNCGVSTVPWVSARRPVRALVEPSVGAATSIANDDAPTQRPRPISEMTTDSTTDTMSIVVMGR